MKKLILDYSKWRCGAMGEYRIGEGNTYLLNQEGYMCCLGQFSLQLNNKLTTQDIRCVSLPDKIFCKVKGLNYGRDGEYFNTKLSNAAAHINDDDNTTPSEKITALKELFAKNGYEIEVINQPPSR